MGTQKIFSLIVLFILAGNLATKSQNFSVSDEFRPKVEYHDVVTTPGIDPISLITQR